MDMPDADPFLIPDSGVTGTDRPERPPIPDGGPRDAGIDAAPPGDAGVAAGFQVRASIDGRSQLVLKGNTAKWHHIAQAAPGKLNNGNAPTRIGGVDWFPTWPQPGENRNCNCDSDTFTGVLPVMPAQDLQIIIQEVDIPEDVRLIQAPSAANSFTAIVEFDDVEDSGADDYIINVIFVP